MNTNTVRELKSIAKDKDLRGYCKFKKDDLVSLLLEQSAEEMLAPPPRTKVNGKRPALPVKIICNSQEMNEFEKEEMKKSRAVVKNRLNEWYDWLVDYVPKPITNVIRKSF